MSNIEWTDKTWNPVTGCDKVSPGCKFCYAEGIADRFFAKQYPPNPDGSERKFTDVRCHPDRLTEPRHWKKPSMVFVNSMSDLFHEDVPRDFIGVAFAIMRECGRHTFQILTKRPERMLTIVNWIRQSETGPISPNIWLGVSVEDKKRKDRIDILRQVPAAVRFLSIEPQLEDVGDLQLGEKDCPHSCMKGIDQRDDAGKVWRCELCGGLFSSDDKPVISWVICGGESGPGARPFNLAWAESLLKQCQAAGVPFFMKQVGSVPMESDERWRAKPIRLLNALNHRRVPAGFVPLKMADRKGGDPLEWPEHLRVRQFPSSQMEQVK